jgi:hypothetical protein
MPKYNFHCTHDIQAGPEKVWEVLTDVASFPLWNPMIVKLSGDVTVGEKFKFTVRGIDGRLMKLTAKFKTITPGKELRWGGGLPGLIYGEHYFVIEPKGNSACTFHHGENWRGLFMRFIWGWLEPRGKPLYPAMSTALKQRVESICSHCA